MTDKAPVCCINGAVHRERPAWAPRRDRPLARRSSTGGAGSPRELARLIRSSDESVETCIAHCDVAARDLLMPRTMNGTEVDQLISDVLARKARAIELARRADCKRRELSARTFLAETKSRE